MDIGFVIVRTMPFYDEMIASVPSDQETRVRTNRLRDL
jgi:hypothetical protein